MEHSYKNKIILNHDPLKKGNSLNVWIKKFNHKFLIVNIKEEGLEKHVKKIIEKENIHKYNVVYPGIKIKLTTLNVNLEIFRVLDYVRGLKIKVFKKIEVGFFTSGNELKKPRTKLKGSEINNSNYYSLITLLDFNFINKVYCGNLKDRAQYIENKLKYNSKKFNVIITTGGASVGEEDYLIEVINKIGKILFWKAAIKPGRPVALGKVDDCYVICLPGNPVSVQLLYALIIQPFIYYLAGAKFVLPQPEKLKVNFNMNKKTKRMEWLRVKKKKNNLEFIAEKFPKQGSGMISSIAYSDGIIEIPEHVSKIKIGESYDYFDFKILFS